MGALNLNPTPCMFKYICIFVGSVGFLLLLSLFFRWLVLCQVRSILRRKEPEVILIVEEVGDVVYVQLQDITGTEEYQCPCHLGHCQVTCLKALGHNAM